jgi:hypothetical protein
VDKLSTEYIHNHSAKLFICFDKDKASDPSF